jgi:trimethylamine---corrinoid protein Co-methyltransferase
MTLKRYEMDERFERIHAASIEILEKTGFEVCSEALVSRCKANGLKHEGNRIFFSERDIEKALSTVQSRFHLQGRNPDRSLYFEAGKSYVGLGRSAPFVIDGNGERRTAIGEDLIEFLKLGQMLDEIQLVGNLVSPSDLPPERAYEFMMAAQIRYSDKPYHLLHPSDIPLLCLAFDIDASELSSACDNGKAYAHSTINTLSPLFISPEQSDLLIAMAENGIPFSVSPAPAMGSTSPCTIAGSLVVNNAEILAVLVMTQIIRPGVPVFYGVFPSGTDMRSMNATYGSPEARILEAGAVQMAKRYGLLTRGNVGLNEAFDCDFQAGAEGMLNFASAFQNQINYLPGCGMMASFAAASKSKLLLDAELAGYARRLAQPWTAEPEDLGVNAIIRTGPKGSFLTSSHTLSRCRSEFCHPRLLCRTTFENWRERGNLLERAEAWANRLLETYTPPPLTPKAQSILKECLFCE